MFTAVTTTRIFCRAECPAGPAKPGNFLLLKTVRDCLAIGCRPCKRCRPLQFKNNLPIETPDLFHVLLREETAHHAAELPGRKSNREKLERWFSSNFEMTLDCYFRLRRLAGELHAEYIKPGTLCKTGVRFTKRCLPFRQLLESKTVELDDAAEPVIVNRIMTKLGPMVACSTENGICLLEFADRRMLETQLVRVANRISPNFRIGINTHLVQLEQEFGEYFSGSRDKFGVALCARGTSFQQAVWSELVKVNSGDRISYSELARRVTGSSAGVRAIGKANGDNGLTILVPCHRVVGADGSLTGYGGGLWRKQWLLDHEAQMSKKSHQRKRVLT